MTDDRDLLDHAEELATRARESYASTLELLTRALALLDDAATRFDAIASLCDITRPFNPHLASDIRDVLAGRDDAS